MNQYIEKQIKVTYGKTFEEMSDVEKESITEISIFAENFRGQSTDIKIPDLASFPNIQRCLIKGFALSDEDINFLIGLKSLKGVQFSNCDFSQATSLNSDLELIVLDGCEGVSNQFLRGNTSLRILKIVNQEYFDVSSLGECSSLEQVYLQKTRLTNLINLRRLPGLKFVNLDGSSFNFFVLLQLRRVVKVEYQKDFQPGVDR